MIIGVRGSTPGVRKFATIASARNQYGLRLYSQRELMMRTIPSTKRTTGSSKTSPKPMVMIRTKLTSSLISGKYDTSAVQGKPEPPAPTENVAKGPSSSEADTSKN